jgi:acetylglutamate synthase
LKSSLDNLAVLFYNLKIENASLKTELNNLHVAVLQSLATTKKTKDQFDAFGQYIAEKFGHIICILVKRTINYVIFEAELGNNQSFQHQEGSNLYFP